MRPAVLASAMVACGMGCAALAFVPGLAIPAEAACALGAGLGASGLILLSRPAEA